MEIRWTEEAANWLEDIFRYIAEDNPEAARRTVTAIYDKALSLSKFPKIGSLHRTIREGEIRVILHEHYRIAYLLTIDGPIQVLGIFHGALDIDRYL